MSEQYEKTREEYKIELYNWFKSILEEVHGPKKVSYLDIFNTAKILNNKFSEIAEKLDYIIIAEKEPAFIKAAIEKIKIDQLIEFYNELDASLQSNPEIVKHFIENSIEYSDKSKMVQETYLYEFMENLKNNGFDFESNPEVFELAIKKCENYEIKKIIDLFKDDFSVIKKCVPSLLKEICSRDLFLRNLEILKEVDSNSLNDQLVKDRLDSFFEHAFNWNIADKFNQLYDIDSNLTKDYLIQTISIMDEDEIDILNMVKKAIDMDFDNMHDCFDIAFKRIRNDCWDSIKGISELYQIVKDYDEKHETNFQDTFFSYYLEILKIENPIEYYESLKESFQADPKVIQIFLEICNEEELPIFLNKIKELNPELQKNPEIISSFFNNPNIQNIQDYFEDLAKIDKSLQENKDVLRSFFSHYKDKLSGWKRQNYDYIDTYKDLKESLKTNPGIINFCLSYSHYPVEMLEEIRNENSELAKQYIDKVFQKCYKSDIPELLEQIRLIDPELAKEWVPKAFEECDDENIFKLMKEILEIDKALGTKIVLDYAYPAFDKSCFKEIKQKIGPSTYREDNLPNLMIQFKEIDKALYSSLESDYSHIALLNASDYKKSELIDVFSNVTLLNLTMENHLKISEIPYSLRYPEYISSREEDNMYETNKDKYNEFHENPKKFIENRVNRAINFIKILMQECPGKIDEIYDSKIFDKKLLSNPEVKKVYEEVKIQEIQNSNDTQKEINASSKNAPQFGD